MVHIKKKSKKSLSLLLVIYNLHVCVYVQSLSPVKLFVTLWIIACLVPLSMGFSQQEYWGRLPFPPPGDLPNPGIKPTSPAPYALQVDSSSLSYRRSPVYNLQHYKIAQRCRPRRG